MSRLALSIILLATGLVWLVAELIQVGGRWTVISVILKDWGLASCTLPFGWCLLAGHLWMNWDLWDKRTPFNLWPVWVVILCALVVVDAIYIIWVKAPRPEWPLVVRVARYPGLWTLIGLAAGALTWPQRAIL